MGSSLLVLVTFLLTLNGHFAPAWAKTKVHIVYMGEGKHYNPNLVTESHYEMLASVVGSKEAAFDSLVYSYRHGFSGFAAKLTDSQVEYIAGLPGVIEVIPNLMYSLKTTRSWDYLGLYLNSDSNLLYKANMGDGIIVGVFDTGIWPESKSYYDKGLGPIPTRWKGRCESGDQLNAKNHCNRNIIGEKWFIDGVLADIGVEKHNFNISEISDYLSARDGDGHGTHTSSTAAGSIVNNVNYKGIISGRVRGGAPKARIAMYKVCWKMIGCSSAGVLKAFDEAIHDGVDLLSISLGPAHIPLYSHVDTRDITAVGSFHAVARGIPVICSSSNEGPYAMTVLNTAPWILTIAATTIDRSFPTRITLGNNVTVMGQSLLTGKETNFVSLVSSEEFDLSSNESVSSTDKSSVESKVVLFFDVVTNTDDLAEIFRQPGVIGFIVAQNPNNLIPRTSPGFPFAIIDYELGTKILNYIHTTR